MPFAQPITPATTRYRVITAGKEFLIMAERSDGAYWQVAATEVYADAVRATNALSGTGFAYINWVTPNLIATGGVTSVTVQGANLLAGTNAEAAPAGTILVGGLTFPVFFGGSTGTGFVVAVDTTVTNTPHLGVGTHDVVYASGETSFTLYGALIVQ